MLLFLLETNNFACNNPIGCSCTKWFLDLILARHFVCTFMQSNKLFITLITLQANSIHISQFNLTFCKYYSLMAGSIYKLVNNICLTKRGFTNTFHNAVSASENNAQTVCLFACLSGCSVCLPVCWPRCLLNKHTFYYKLAQRY